VRRVKAGEYLRVFTHVRGNMALELHLQRVMLTVGLTEAKRRFEELVGRAERGERIRITKYGKLMAKLAPVSANRRKPSALERADKYSRKKP
jgi:prevent-host-death family protein